MKRAGRGQWVEKDTYVILSLTKKSQCEKHINSQMTNNQLEKHLQLISQAHIRQFLQIYKKKINNPI